MTNQAVFLDRDGTMIEHYDYLTDPGQVRLLAHTGPALRLLKERGYLLVMVTNQSAVARGMLTEKKLVEIHDHLQSLLSRQGVFLDKIYYCPYLPDAAVEKYNRQSDLRKPKPGMLTLAGRELDIDLSRSWMIGDDDRDVGAGCAAGCRTIMLETRGSSLVRRGDSEPDFKAVNLLEAANLVLRHGRAVSPRQNTIENEDHRRQEEIEQQKKETAQQQVENAQQEEAIIQRESDGAVPGETDMEDQAETADELDMTDSAEKFNGTPDHTSMLDSDSFLRQILRELKRGNRDRNLPEEFSVFRLIAMVIQMLVLLALVLAVVFGTGREPDEAATQNCLLLAVVFQTLTLTLLTMHRQQ